MLDMALPSQVKMIVRRSPASAGRFGLALDGQDGQLAQQFTATARTSTPWRAPTAQQGAVGPPVAEASSPAARPAAPTSCAPDPRQRRPRAGLPHPPGRRPASPSASAPGPDGHLGGRRPRPVGASAPSALRRSHAHVLVATRASPARGSTSTTSVRRRRTSARSRTPARAHRRPPPAPGRRRPCRRHGDTRRASRSATSAIEARLHQPWGETGWGSTPRRLASFPQRSRRRRTSRSPPLAPAPSRHGPAPSGRSTGSSPGRPGPARLADASRMI